MRCAQALQATVGAIRNARAEYNVELGRRIAAQLRVAQPELAAALRAELPVLCSLAKLDPAQVPCSWNRYVDRCTCRNTQYITAMHCS